MFLEEACLDVALCGCHVKGCRTGFLVGFVSEPFCVQPALGVFKHHPLLCKIEKKTKIDFDTDDVDPFLQDGVFYAFVSASPCQISELNSVNAIPYSLCQVSSFQIRYLLS